MVLCFGNKKSKFQHVVCLQRLLLRICVSRGDSGSECARFRITPRWITKENIAYYPSMITISCAAQWRQRRRKSIIEIRPLILTAITSLEGVRFYNRLATFIHPATLYKIFAMQLCVMRAKIEHAVPYLCNGEMEIQARHWEHRVRFSGTRDALFWLSHQQQQQREVAAAHTLLPTICVTLARHTIQCTLWVISLFARRLRIVCAPDCALCKLPWIMRRARTGAEN